MRFPIFVRRGGGAVSRNREAVLVDVDMEMAEGRWDSERDVAWQTAGWQIF